MLELRNPVLQLFAPVTELLVDMLRLWHTSWNKSRIREEAYLIYYRRCAKMDADMQSFLKARRELKNLEQYAAEADMTLRMTQEVLITAMQKTAEGIAQAFHTDTR